LQTRRNFIKNLALAGGGLAINDDFMARFALKKPVNSSAVTIFRAINGNPRENMAKVIELMGGIEKIIGPWDVVVIKPNVQWWNQGAPNLAALQALVDLIMQRPGGFSGEVVVAENCHRGKEPWNSAGWSSPFLRNGDETGVTSFNQLTTRLKQRYGSRYSTVHWIDVAVGGRRVYGPGPDKGYVYCDGTGNVPLLECRNDMSGRDSRTTIMTYPIFTTDRGWVVDLNNGVWEKGSYSDRPLRFVNLAALNHHSTYCGFTSLLKNYLGVSDLSGGPDPAQGGKLTGDFYNFHSFPFNQWGKGPQAGMIGRAVGTYLKTIRRADLNIITAEWVGLASRTNLPAARTRTVLASFDPVALDFHAAKYLLYANSKLWFHDPEKKGSPAREYLRECSKTGGGNFDEKWMRVLSYDLAARRIQPETELSVRGEIRWGKDPNSLMKYLVMRYLTT
jgi:hypothetical protein